jgi:4-hydroxy-2-oxoglutarate aldolase
MDLDGIYPPVPTPFDPVSGNVDTQALIANVRRLSATRLRGLLVLGSNGEAGLLDEAEGDAVVAAARDALAPGKLLLVGTGRESTRATIAASARAATLGADAVLVKTPSLFKSQMTPDALAAYFTAIADASPVPVILYNLPGVTGITLMPPLVAKLAQHANIAGLKETSPDLERLGLFVASAPKRFKVLTGWAPVAYPAFMAGASGAILAVANVLPDACVTLFDYARGGRHAEALALQQRLTPIAQLVSSIHGVPGLKLALDLAGFPGGPVRGPLQAAPAKAREEITAALAMARSG